MAASIIDVAKLAKVSPATVSRVLNGTTGVSTERAARVRAAVEKLQYQPFSPARALRRQLTDVWAVVVADIQNPFFTSVVRGIEDGAREAKSRVLLCNSDEDVAKEAGYIDVAIGERVGGVVIAVASTKQTNLAPLMDAGIPVVAIDRRPIGAQVDTVLVDNRAAANDATRHLIEQGAERVACITGPRRLSTANERLKGYKDAVGGEGIVVREDFRQAGGQDAVAQLFAGKARPDALFVANNEMTLGALQALQGLGLRVPDDVAVAGFDDVPWATLVQPSLTVVAQPTYDIGRSAAELLTTAKRGENGSPREVLLQAKLIVRDSSARR